MITTYYFKIFYSLFRSCFFFLIFFFVSFDIYRVLTCRATLKISNSRGGYWVSELIFVSWNTRFIGRYSFIHFCTENFRFISLHRKGIKRKKVNQKPNISSCLTFSEAVMNYVWYQATRSKKCWSNCLFFSNWFGFHI